MIIELPGSKQKVDVRITRWQDNNGYRFTQVTVFTPEPTYHCIAEGKSRCSPKDNFCKLTGRKLAYQKMINSGILWSKDDRRAIFQAVCPSYFKSKKACGAGSKPT